MMMDCKAATDSGHHTLRAVRMDASSDIVQVQEVLRTPAPDLQGVALVM